MSMNQITVVGWSTGLVQNKGTISCMIQVLRDNLCVNMNWRKNGLYSYYVRVMPDCMILDLRTLNITHM